MEIWAYVCVCVCVYRGVCNISIDTRIIIIIENQFFSSRLSLNGCRKEKRRGE